MFKEKNIIISHRGIYDNIKIPENTISSFKKALSYNYPIELDIQLTKDNVLVVFHDDNLKRMTGLNRKISDMTYNEIKNLYLLSTNNKIPTLEEVLKLINGKVLLVIEIKKVVKYRILIDKLMSLLNNYYGAYVIQSFDYRSLMYLKKKDPLIKRGLLLSNKKSFISNFIKLIIIKMDFISISKNLLNNGNYQKFINNYPSLIWTINSLNELDLYINKYNGYVCNNLPYKKN